MSARLAAALSVDAFAARLCTLILLASLPLPAEARTRGRVVDAATGEALEGAVIAVASYRHPFIPAMDPVPIFYKADEAVSDVDGAFEVDTSPGWRGVVLYEQVSIVFKPGYEPIVRGSKPLVDPITRLVKLRSRPVVGRLPTAAYFEFRVCSSAPFCVPPERVPKLVEVVRLQRKIYSPDALAPLERE